MKIVKASAALSLAFKAQTIGDKAFIDGGMGDRIRAQGNTPVEPLLNSGCTHAFVVLIGDGSGWDRHEWKDIIPIEIRPSESIAGKSRGMFTINFDPDRIRELISLGERDALRSLGKVKEALKSYSGMVAAADEAAQAYRRLESGDNEWDSVVRKFNRRRDS